MVLSAESMGELITESWVVLSAESLRALTTKTLDTSSALALSPLSLPPVELQASLPAHCSPHTPKSLHLELVGVGTERHKEPGGKAGSL